MVNRPLIGITTDIDEERLFPRSFGYLPYARAVHAAGGIPVQLPPLPEAAREHLDAIDGLVLAGGDDPRTEPFGQPTHPAAIPVHDLRQQYETDLLRALDQHRPDLPLLGICLGMQMMALVAGGRLNQHLPDTHPSPGDHWEHDHPVLIEGPFASHPLGFREGAVRSRHRQAVDDPGRLRVAGRAPDGVIEILADPDRPFHVGVQWHPERTPFAPLGLDLFRALVDAARTPLARVFSV